MAQNTVEQQQKQCSTIVIMHCFGSRRIRKLKGLFANFTLGAPGIVSRSGMRFTLSVFNFQDPYGRYS